MNADAALRELAAVDAASPPPPGRRITAADLDRALARHRRRSAALAFGIVLAAGVAWFCWRAPRPAAAASAIDVAVLRAELEQMRQSLERQLRPDVAELVAADRLTARTIAASELAARTVAHTDPLAAARQREFAAAQRLRLPTASSPR